MSNISPAAAAAAAASQFGWLHRGQTEMESVFRNCSWGICLGGTEVEHLTFSSPAPPFRSCVRWRRERRGYSTCSAAWQTPPWPPPAPCCPGRPTLFCAQSENGGEDKSDRWLGKLGSDIAEYLFIFFTHLTGLFIVFQQQKERNFKSCRNGFNDCFLRIQQKKAKWNVYSHLNFLKHMKE